MTRPYLFRIFDWLHERGHLSKEGTVADYAVVMGVVLVHAVPICAAAAAIAWLIA